jgi:hypothetical protein
MGPVSQVRRRRKPHGRAGQLRSWRIPRRRVQQHRISDGRGRTVEEEAEAQQADPVLFRMR